MQIVLQETEPKKQNKRKTKLKVKIKTEIKPPKKGKINAPKWKRKSEINIDETSKKPKEWRRESKKLSIDWIVERKRRKKEKKIKKTRKKAIKGLVDFNNFIRDEVVEPGQKRSFNLAARNLKQENINSYCWWKEESIKFIQCIS